MTLFLYPETLITVNSGLNIYVDQNVLKKDGLITKKDKITKYGKFKT